MLLLLGVQALPMETLFPLDYENGQRGDEPVVVKGGWVWFGKTILGPLGSWEKVASFEWPNLVFLFWFVFRFLFFTQRSTHSQADRSTNRQTDRQTLGISRPLVENGSSTANNNEE